jgi:hypothetical protein
MPKLISRSVWFTAAGIAFSAILALVLSLQGVQDTFEFVDNHAEAISAMAALVAAFVSILVFSHSAKTARETVNQLQDATHGELRAYLHMSNPRISIFNDESGKLRMSLKANFTNSGRTPAFTVYGDLVYKHEQSEHRKNFSDLTVIILPEKYLAIGAGESEEVVLTTFLEEDVLEDVLKKLGYLDVRIWMYYSDIFGFDCSFCMEVQANLMKYLAKQNSPGEIRPLEGAFGKPEDREILVIHPQA